MKTINDFAIVNQNVLLRVDLNVPVNNGIVTDETRIYSIQSSINKLRSNNNKIFLLSHFGRPEGQYNKKYSLRFLCKILTKILQTKKIYFVDSLDQDKIETVKNLMIGGNICLLENIRFYKEEESNNLHFAKKISNYFDVYVNDAFSASHRNHASITGITQYLPSVIGNHHINEIENLNKLLMNPTKPKTAIIGGAKVSSKLQLLNNLIDLFDTVIIGGAMANTFLYAKGYDLGKSFVEKNLIKDARAIMEKSDKLKTKIILPVDAVCSSTINDLKEIKLIDINNIGLDQIIFDIGKNTIKLIKTHLQKSKIILWNGPLGAFENKPFDEGTNKVVKIIKQITSSNNIKTIAGGGDTLAAIKKTNIENSFTYLSTAGGAFLEWLEGKESPGIKALKENNFS